MDQIKLIEALEADVQMHMRVAVKAIDAKVALAATVEGQAKRIAELEALIDTGSKQEAVGVKGYANGTFVLWNKYPSAEMELFANPVVAPDVRKDAERYQWLREYLPSDDMSADDDLVAALNPQEIDTAIDKAMGGQQ